MARWHQTWTCTACGHVGHKTVSYPKYGASETPLQLLELRARCVKCGARGRCLIREERAVVRKKN